MGSENRDRWSAEDWRMSAETVGQMIQDGWNVMSVCSRCASKRWTDLKLVVCVHGPKASLWNKQARCRQVGCEGVVHFVGVPPGLGSSYTVKLSAEWVGAELRNPPGRR